MILKAKNGIDLLFSLFFLTILQIFGPEVTVIQDQVLINVGAYEPKTYNCNDRVT